LPGLVLDSFAVLAFLFAEPGHEKVLAVREKAAETDSDLLIASPNWAEVRYIVERKVGLAEWREARARLLGLALEIVPAGVIAGSLLDRAGDSSHRPSY
jgi:predicted nucleic acid-binding protein